MQSHRYLKVDQSQLPIRYATRRSPTIMMQFPLFTRTLGRAYLNLMHKYLSLANPHPRRTYNDGKL